MGTRSAVFKAPLGTPVDLPVRPVGAGMDHAEPTGGGLPLELVVDGWTAVAP
jgi:hypothetical protein